MREQKALGKKWSELPSKDLQVYVPLLQAFMNEIQKSNSVDSTVPRKMVEYLLGEFDFYKVISIDSKRITRKDFEAVIEISKGSKMKYELDKETGLLRLDRVLYTSTHYPANYGFIPRTYAKDNDPLDVLVLCSGDILPMSIVDCYPIGVITMLDNGAPDDKIISIPFNDPTYSSYKDISQLPAHVFDEMKHFFAVYKTLESKDTAIDEVKGVLDAVAIIEDAIKAYEEKFGK